MMTQKIAKAAAKTIMNEKQLVRTWYDSDVRFVADTLVSPQLRDYHDPVLRHGDVRWQLHC